MLPLLEHLKFLEGGLFIYSMWPGYRDKEKVEGLLNYIEYRNMERTQLHTSGHGGIQTLQKIVNNCRPKQIIPIHTGHSDKFAAIFENVTLLKDEEIFTVK